MKKYIILPLFLLALSCSEKGIENYSDTNYVIFPKDITDSINFSFVFFAEDKVLFPVQVEFVGKTLVNDLEYFIEVDKKNTTLSEKLYKLPDKFIIKKGENSSKFFIEFTNNAELQSTMYNIELVMKRGKDVGESGDIFGRKVIKVSDMASRPDWWTTADVKGSIESNYLGKYSALKYGKFCIATGVYDMKGFSNALLRQYSITFKRWLKANGPIWDEENGEEMQVTVVGE